MATRWHRPLAALLGVLIMLTPSLAAARSGAGWRRSDPNQGGAYSSPPGPAPAVPGETAPVDAPARPASPAHGYSSIHPYLAALFGGVFGSWLGEILFLHWGAGVGAAGVALAILVWLVLLGGGWTLFRFLAARKAVAAPAPPAAGAAILASRAVPLGVAAADYGEFESILKNVQRAWSAGDIGALGLHVTPNLLVYFSEQLAENQNRGVCNRVEDVELLRGEAREAWNEGQMHYALTLMQWRARDFTIASGASAAGEIVLEGSRERPSETSEIWTFARQPGERWLLAAIEQI